MSTNDGPGVPPEQSPEKTTVFRADFLADSEGQEPPAPEPSVAGGSCPSTGTPRAPAGTRTATSSSTT